ncbi:ASCH domain-containing protein [Bacillus salacetis]|uniref:ASCH domain-containing protein n=1 Tax=Bacillus salacetis TaxID=2315464 RepID=UPI003BA11363
MKNEHPSVKEMWQKYLLSIDENPRNTMKSYDSWYFCDNEPDANELAELVLQGKKRGTASLYQLFGLQNEDVPQEGWLSIITNWAGEAQCIIETIKVDIVPFKEVTPEFAAIEGEGDKSLQYWRDAHWRFFSRELAERELTPSEDMLVVCEQFRVVHH